MSRLDLHTHSTASDGTDSPAELVTKAAAQGLETVALTDHDTLAGLAEGEEAARDLGIRFIRGCELSTTTDQGSMHILGLWLPHECDALEAFLSHLREKRATRNTRMLEKLRSLGIMISMDDVLKHADATVGRPHMAAAMIEKGYVENIDEAFSLYLGIGGAAYVPKLAPRPEQAVRILNGMGATVSVAHPLLRRRPPGWLETFAQALIPLGLNALEAWHSAQDMAQTQWLRDLARNLDLNLTGGSDYHGARKPGIKLGMAGENQAIPGHLLDALLADRRRRGLPCA